MSSGRAPLQMLEELFVAFICGSLIPAIMPGPVRMNKVHRFKKVADKGMRCNGNTLLGEPGVNQMDLLKAGRDNAEPFQFSCSYGNAWVMVVGKPLGDGDGCITSQVCGARHETSWASKACNRVEPVLGSPVMKRGRLII